MNYECLHCGHIICGSRVCPVCHTTSFTPSSSTITIEEVGEEEEPNLRKRRASGSAEELASTIHPPLRRPRLLPQSSYALVHTLGLNAPDPMGGDGAYADWLHRHFLASLDPEGCIAVQQMIYGQRRVGRDAALIPLLNDDFSRQFQQILGSRALTQTRTIILNWHIRRTGRPNAWTGRGSNRGLVESLQGLARRAGFRLIVVYTVHESEGLGNDWANAWCFYPTALLALNPTVQQFLQNSGLPTGLSQVPSLMTSLHTTSVDIVLRFLQGESADFLNLAGACLLHRLRLQNTYTHSMGNRMTRGFTGVLIFGMITTRHGTTVDNVRNLCSMFRRAQFPDSFKVIIVGKTQDRDLARDLRILRGTMLNLVFHGELDFRDAFNTVAGCPYAISFDPAGYRDNASAMVNVTRAGHLLFSRNSGERDDDLIRRAVFQIKLCEMRSGHLISLLAAQQPRFRATEPAAVGNRLDLFFRDLAKK
ncbi:MAG: hypothetical protein EPN33_00875 [Acidobacteria bacterium]|nr:MAG: hypothetical protein EPN33_00875 [Acidobacteriota bacterium]